MQALRLNEVLTRVVAWHNRHPLARRIRANQVHSVGEVVLPFASASASARAAAATPAAPNPPSMSDLLAPPATALTDLHAPAESDQTGAGRADETAASAPAPAPAPAPVPAEPAGGLDADPGAPASMLSEARVVGDTAPEPAPVLSMEDEADDLFGSGPQAGPAAPDDRGPERLIEPSTDPAEPLDAAPADSSAQPSDDGAADPTPGFGTIDADSATPAAAFSAACAAADAADVPAPHTATGNLAHPTPPDDSTGRPASGASIDPAIAAAQAGAAAADSARSAVPQPQAGAATPVTSGLLARLLAPLKRWRNGTGAKRLPRLQPTFSRDFIWPLRPGQVARWARRHGSLAPLAPADWPQRLIDIDVKLQAQAWRDGLPHALPLHVLTAAIGVGDRRIRVLIDGRGHILGPRSYSPPRLATLASLVALGLLGAGGVWLPRAESRGPQLAIADVASAAVASAAVTSAAAAASAAAPAASAANAAAALASDAEKLWLAQQAGPLSAGPAPAAAPPGQSVPVAQEAASGPDQAPPPAPQPTTATLGNILPALSPADKQSARLQAEALRSSQAATKAAQPPPTAGPVFAIVTRPTREKDSAARSLALIRASGQRLRGEVPEHGELMLNQGQWRAAWWPFENQADAERARVMLAARGLHVEVVEF